MFYVYIIKFLRNWKLYIGRTSDLKRRLKEHVENQSKSTKNKGPFVLIYYEAYRSQRDAYIRERKLKKFKNSYAELKKRLKYSLVG